MKFDSDMNNSYFLKPNHFSNISVRKVELLTQFCKIWKIFMEILWLLLFKTVYYIETNRHENFCRCGIDRIDAKAFFSQTLLILRYHHVYCCFCMIYQLFLVLNTNHELMIDLYFLHFASYQNHLTKSSHS